MPGSANYNVVMELDEPIQDLLPYLAAGLRGCTYKHGTDVINYMDRGHIVAIYPHHLTITDVKDSAEGESFCCEYFQKILHVKSNMENIEPTYDKRSTLTLLDILRTLPKTNCAECGSITCTEFAAKVYRSEENISKCGHLMIEKENHQEFFNKLQSNGYEI